MSSKSHTVHFKVLLVGIIITFKFLISFNSPFECSPLKATSLINFSTAVIVFCHGFLFFKGKIPTDWKPAATEILWEGERGCMEWPVLAGKKRNKSGLLNLL